MIFSESSFKYTNHSCKDWIGLGGINLPVWRDQCFYNVHNDTGNIYMVAYILRYYLDQSNGNYREALHKYKSYTPLGLVYAKKVLHIRKGMK